MRICLVKTSSMGDIIHTLPALTDAQKAIPHLQVNWVVEPAFEEIPHWHSAVKQTIPVSIRHWRKHLCQRQTWQAWQAYQRQLQAVEYDAIIDAQGLLKSALCVTHFAKGKKYGYDKQSVRERFSSYFYDQTFHIPYQQHAVERIRLLFAHTLGYPIPTTQGDYGIAHHFLCQKGQAEKSGNTTAYAIAIHATTRADKHWQEIAWLTLFNYLNSQGLEVRLPWGNLVEKARAERLATQAKQVKVLPKLTLTELAEQLAGATVIISVDTGLSHLAASLDRPNIILYGATDPKLIGAYGKHQYPLYAKGMTNIHPQQVINQLMQIL